MMTINFDTITNNYEVIYVIKTVMKYHLKKIDTSFHQPLPNMVQRLFVDERICVHICNLIRLYNPVPIFIGLNMMQCAA
jgi:hypothetical protein